MGMSPAPAIANLFVAIYEIEVIIPTFKNSLISLFIQDLLMMA